MSLWDGATKRDEAGWIEWKGGECPVEMGTLVDVRYRDGGEAYHVPAGVQLYGGPISRRCAARWCHANSSLDIIAYRLSDRLAGERSVHADPSPSEAKIQALEARVKALEGGLDKAEDALWKAFHQSRSRKQADIFEAALYAITELLGSEGRDDG